jgi:alginate O-acetyltransferase complex protein AlgI
MRRGRFVHVRVTALGIAMLFSEPVFFAFFALYFAAHVLTPREHRNTVIIAGGAIFYSYWNPFYAWVPFLLLVISFFGAQYMEQAEKESVRKTRFILTVFFLLIPLFAFKYTNFFFEAIIGPFHPVEGKLVDWPLPLGISFVTFTLIAYLADVYRRKFPLEKSLHTLTAYVVFFPHLIAGPILRPHELIPQLQRPLRALDARAKLGLAIFTAGLIKKLIFADQLAILVDRVYGASDPLHGLDYLLAVYGFSLQIYCDFSGYTDMAIGLAILLRIRLPNNFSRPYGAVSFVDFWRRWHITLSRWLRDYLYIPLGGNRGRFAFQARNILITMILGGLWHGANWTFMLWGGIHGIAIVLSHLLRKVAWFQWLGTVPRWLRIFVVFHLITLTWVFFRAPDLDTVGRILSGFFLGNWTDAIAVTSRNMFPILLLVVFLLTHRYDSHARFRLLINRLGSGFYWMMIVVLWILAISVSAGSSAKFIYFDF